MKPALTPRQHEVLVLLANDLTREAVAETLGISPLSVRSHLTRAYKELGVSTNTGAFIKMGWLKPPKQTEV